MTIVDGAMSTPALYSTEEECRSWQQSFAALLGHKYGCDVFRQFLKEEFNDDDEIYRGNNYFFQ